jgi:Icc-related predicted phosphoesterase
MNLCVVSDLHLEFCRDGGRSLLDEHPWPKADALIAAGDIGTTYNAWTLMTAFECWSARYERVFFVPGNHEFYKDSVAPALRTLHEVVAKYPKVVLLEPGVVSSVGSFRVLGGTLWFPDGPENALYQNELNDFVLIKKFLPWVYEENKRHVEWLTSEMKPGDIVVTHHLPSRQSIASLYKGSSLNRFFVCDMEDLIEERGPILWVHGHTHNSMDYRIGPTRVVANPRGYPLSVKPENKTYKAPLRVELP